MLISAAPVAIPVTTANPPTEAVAAEAAQKSPIPQPASTTDSPNSRNSTEANAHSKGTAAGNQVNEKDSSKEKGGKQSQQQQQEQRQAQQQQVQQRQQIQQLRRTDREVRAHETAHASVGGQLAGAPTLQFTTGPDGKRYAIGGEVSIDSSKVPNDPQATIEKMLQVQRAALAPVNPSAQDFKVAAIASQVANQARVELNLQRSEQAGRAGNEKLKGEPSRDTRRGSAIYFTSPITARRASLILNQKIAKSGALAQAEIASLLSQKA